MWGNSKDANFCPSLDFIPQSTGEEFVKIKSKCVSTYLRIESKPCSKKDYTIKHNWLVDVGQFKTYQILSYS
jgi:hypothetical protein